MIDWKELDAALLLAIHRDGIRTFTAIAQRVEEQAKPHAARVSEAKGYKHAVAPWRIVDRRLQALRAKGVLEFRSKEWHRAA